MVYDEFLSSCLKDNNGFLFSLNFSSFLSYFASFCFFYLRWCLTLRWRRLSLTIILNGRLHFVSFRFWKSNYFMKFSKIFLFPNFILIKNNHVTHSFEIKETKKYLKYFKINNKNKLFGKCYTNVKFLSR